MWDLAGSQEVRGSNPLGSTSGNGRSASTCSPVATEDRAALIGRLSQREDTTWLAELLIEIETDPDDITRMRLIDGLEKALAD